MSTSFRYRLTSLNILCYFIYHAKETRFGIGAKKNTGLLDLLAVTLYFYCFYGDEGVADGMPPLVSL